MPRKSHCVRGHARTPGNVDASYMCRTCRNDRKRMLRAADTRPKDPRKVRAGNASAIARRQRGVPVAAPATPTELTPAIALYRAEKAKRQALRGAA